MSLKMFHVVFIAASLLLSAGVGVWSFWQFAHVGGWGMLGLGVTAILGGTALVIYSRTFFRKLKHISYL